MSTFATIGEVPAPTAGHLLTIDEQDRLEKAAAEGDTAAAERLFTSYLPLVKKVSGRYHSAQLGRSDLFQAGSIGLLLAVRTFNPARGWKFITYAWKMIDYEIIRETRRHRFGTGVGRLSCRMVFEAVDARISRGLPMPTDEEISAETGLPLSKVRMVFTARSAEHGKNSDIDPELDRRAGGQRPDLRLRLLEELRELEEFRTALLLMLDRRLKPKCREVMLLRYGLDDEAEPLDLPAISKHLGVSKQRVEQLEKKGLRMLVWGFKIADHGDPDQETKLAIKKLRKQIARIRNIPDLREAIQADFSRPTGNA
ncbi:hypothetical protein A3D72_02925 [Candidatus Uhrbacteria bacterium RIFCSPHIGHO2_02_FULL_57_19]|uniref:RNA polymerase sigma-70 domain-containing protein n=1 Tax=Candidatus Uhrbacteria bacterium RIFCSPHIGHO2_02_FULL_57_19 TaxID=1802391 RepID=A0A1F7U3P4_9BACT|nr:MAG: hypothetical protein A3D72_02925 [Candidatus Uhrbacteria bacterium RIFCSPHIGHO2_02_FULL_57_19]